MYTKDWFTKWAKYAPDKIAVREAASGSTITYAELNRQSNGLAKQWQKKGIKKGDRIAVLADFCIEYIVILGVAQKLGIILVPLNYRLTTRELDYMISDCEPALTIVQKQYRKLISSEFALILEEMTLKSAGSDVENFFVMEGIEEDHPLMILYTSGTTGFPKGAIYSHKMAFWNALNTQLRLDVTSNDHTLICTPPFHTGGWNVFITPFLFHGASFTLLDKFEPDQVMRLLDEHQATIFMGVPTMVKMMYESDVFGASKLEQLRYLVVGGEAMPLPLIEAWQKKGIPVRQGYGLTEVGPNVASLHHEDAVKKIGSIGTFNFFVDAKLMKSDGMEAAPNEEGELWMKGPVVTPGYWKNPMATSKAIQDGWFKTGDILVQDDEGYFYVKDRIKNMYISGGENVYPAEVEAYFGQHFSINEIAIIGVPDDQWGEVGLAIIFQGKSRSSITELKEFGKDGLAKYKIPKHFIFTSELPKNSSGKIDRVRLEEQYKSN